MFEYNLWGHAGILRETIIFTTKILKLFNQLFSHKSRMAKARLLDNLLRSKSGPKSVQKRKIWREILTFFTLPNGGWRDVQLFSGGHRPHALKSWLKSFCSPFLSSACYQLGMSQLTFSTLTAVTCDMDQFLNKIVPWCVTVKLIERAQYFSIC